MNIYLVLPLICLLLHSCENQKRKIQTSYINIDSTCNSLNNSTKNSFFYTFWGIDSIVKSNYDFVDSIDSISINRRIVKAKYLYAHKGGAIMQPYYILKNSDPKKYKLIDNIINAHVLLIGEKVFSFNGMPGAIHSETIPESTNVIITAHIYSFYSKGVCLGRHIILDSIKKAINSVQTNTSPNLNGIGAGK